jgi:hypothetical protein
VLIAIAGTFLGTAAAAQPTHHTPPSTVPTTAPPTTVAPTTVAPTTEVPTTTTEAPTTTTTEVPPPPSTTEPPIQEPTTTTTEAPPPPSTTEPPIQEPTTTTEAPATTAVPPVDPPDQGRDDDGSGVLDASTDDPSSPGGPSFDPTPVAAAPPVAAADGDTDEVALPSAEWLFSDGRALISAPQPDHSDTRPLWIAVLMGLGAGIGLTATASVVVNNLHREHPET